MSDIGVAHRESVDRVMQEMRDVGGNMRCHRTVGSLLLAPPEVARVDRFADPAVVIRARVKPRPLQQLKLSRQFDRLLTNRFDEVGIEIAFPHQTVDCGTDRGGRAPRANVTVRHAKPGADVQAMPVRTRPDVAPSGGG